MTNEQARTDWLAERFEAQRPRLTAVAHRMLGSASEADDAVQEAWLRLSRTDADAIENLPAWLTTVVSRVCLNVLQSRRVHPEVPFEQPVPEPADGPDPEHEALLADSIGLALLIVLETLSPAERVAFVLHDMFAVPFEEIAPIVGRNAPATRQLASRARRRVQGHDDAGDPDVVRQARLVEAFLTAARGGDFAGLLALLDPEVVLRADAAAVELGAPREARGAQPVGEFVRVARGAKAAVLDGKPVAAWLPDGKPRVVLLFRVARDKIAEIDVIADPAHLGRLVFREP
jgi:RNA polymerase sigma factor (sigma-70 family)